MKYLIIIAFAFSFHFVLAQSKDQDLKKAEFQNIVYLDILEVSQNFLCTYKISNDANISQVDTFYYFTKFTPYDYNKEKYTVEVSYKIIADNAKGDTIFNKTVYCFDSIVVPIPVSMNDEEAHVKIFVISTKKSIKGKIKDKYKDRVCDILFKSYLNKSDKRRKTICIGYFSPNYSEPDNKKILQIHGYDVNDLIIKTIPGVN